MPGVPIFNTRVTLIYLTDDAPKGGAQPWEVPPLGMAGATCLGTIEPKRMVSLALVSLRDIKPYSCRVSAYLADTSEGSYPIHPTH